MFFKLWDRKKYGNIFSEFATNSISEGIKLALSTLLNPIGIVIGEGVKGVMQALYDKSTKIDKKIDRLLREPLLSGIKLLNQGMGYKVTDEKSQAAKDEILAHAHFSLTKAWVLVYDSTEDSLFIKTLDAIALAAHSSHWQLAETELIKLELAVNDQEQKVKILEEVANSQMEYSKAYQHWLGDKNSFQSVPHGYQVQRLFGRSIQYRSIKLLKRSTQARKKIDILINLKTIAQALLQQNKN